MLCFKIRCVGESPIVLPPSYFLPLMVGCSMKTIPNAFCTNGKRKPHILVLPFLFLLLVFGTLWLTGCSDDILNPPVDIPSGEYQGQYALSHNNPADTLGLRSGVSEITLSINSTLKTYSLKPFGDSSRILSSQGAYKLAYRKITFTDRSMKTVSDMALLLNGEFTYTFDGVNLVITQSDAATKREKSFFLLRAR